MTQIEEAMETLISAIQNSKEYNEYQNVKRRVHEQPELEKSINEFRKKNYQMQNNKQIDLYDEMDKLEQEKSRFLENPLVAEYLAAELAFCRIVQKVNWKLVERLDFEVGFENERE